MRSRSIVLALTTVLSFALAGAASADRFWNVSGLVGFGQFSDNVFYPQRDSLADAPLLGLRIGHVLSEHWGYEFAGAWSPTKEAAGAEEDVTYLNGSGSFWYSPVSTRLGMPYAAAGAGYTRRSASSADDDSHFGTFEQALGWMAPINSRTSFRLEARNVLNVQRTHWGETNKADQQYWAGLTYGFGGGKPVDTDGDGVADKKDKCPGTPAGATVDVNGCPSDSDKDGVYDGLDQCPGTPAGVKVDAKGCPVDSDGDGVFDGPDQCPDTPKGATVDDKGCPKDSDGDGVFDGLDQCPNTPSGAKVDAKGCPSDSDGDGVWDGLDKCPNTASGAKVDSDGCPIVVTERETELLDTGMIRLQGVNFETGKSDILPESFGILDDVGAILRKWPQLQVEVGGHTDSRGAAAANQVLSEARANAVRTYLLQKFPDIQGSQLTAKGYGETKPIAPNSGAANLAKNRRVEFVVLNKDVLRKEVEHRRTLQK
ncbi:MAG: OmpA family protein [Candidatus Eisenbacteria bacterium]